MGTGDGLSYGTPENCRQCIGENNYAKVINFVAVGRVLSQSPHCPMDNVDTNLSKPNIIILFRALLPEKAGCLFYLCTSW